MPRKKTTNTNFDWNLEDASVPTTRKTKYVENKPVFEEVLKQFVKSRKTCQKFTWSGDFKSLTVAKYMKRITEENKMPVIIKQSQNMENGLFLVNDKMV